MLQYLFRLTAGRQEQDQGEKDLKVGDINTKLDELAAAASAEEKTAVLQWLVQRSSARMLKWITQIILKDLKVWLVEVSPCGNAVQATATSAVGKHTSQYLLCSAPMQFTQRTGW